MTDVIHPGGDSGQARHFVVDGEYPPCDAVGIDMVANARRSRLLHTGLLLIGLLHMDARLASAQSCASCGGVCGDITTGFGVCVLVGTTCSCSGGAGVCGPPTCSA